MTGGRAVACQLCTVQRVIVAVGRADAGVTLVSQTGCGDGDHWGGQRLTGLTAAQPLVIQHHSFAVRDDHSEVGFAAAWDQAAPLMRKRRRRFGRSNLPQKACTTGAHESIHSRSRSIVLSQIRTALQAACVSSAGRSL